MRLPRSLFACTTLLSGLAFGTASFAAPMPAAPVAKTPSPDSVIATVDNQKITISDIQRAASALPQQARQIQPKVLIPLLINQLIDQKAIQILAEKEGLSTKPEVKSAMDSAAGNVLQNAYLEQQVAPRITDASVKSYYQSHYANQKPEEEVHARHILVSTEAQAQDLIKKLDKGEDFAKLSSLSSTDKASAAAGGDLGWFKRGDMNPAFSNAAFSLKPGPVAQKPIHTEYGWHIVQVLGTRMAPVPTLEEVQTTIRRDMVREEVRKVVEAAEKQVKVTHYDNNGKPISNAAAPMQHGAH